jgi:D-alanyl-D-alanine carboxypeptidase/D-alanyl-D-alanine-endopeptidase (penicillin-binding protein 4)
VTRTRLVGVLAALALAAPAAAAPKRRPTRGARIATQPHRAPAAGDLRRAGGVVTTPTLEVRLREELESIWGGRALRRGVTAVYVVDATTGAELFAVHADDKLNPASNVKLISTATVLDALGPEWRYTTQLFGPTPDDAGVARGALYLRGSGDPTLGKGALGELAAAVAARGVKRIEGDVVLSDQLLRDAVGAASIAIGVSGQGKPGAPATISPPATGFVEVVSTATISSRKRARLTVATRFVDDPVLGTRMRVEIGGAIRQGRRETIERAVEKRSTYTAHALRDALGAAGVEVVGRPRLATFEGYVEEAGAATYLPVVLAEHRSAPMRDLVAQVNKRSLNWLADRLVMTAGAELAGEAPTMGAGIRAMKAWLARAGLDPKDVVVDTGSGLSYATKLSTRQLVKILRVATGVATPSAADGGPFDPAAFRASLAVGGVDGTLRARFGRASVKGQVVGKTGTLTGCVALSGLVSDGGGDSLCFSIVTNGNRHRARVGIRREHDLMVLAMRRYLEARAIERVAGAAAKAAGVAAPVVVAEPAAAPTAELEPAADEAAEPATEAEPEAEGDEPVGVAP